MNLNSGIIRGLPVACLRNRLRAMQGLALLDCVVYMGVLMLLLGLAFAAFYRVHDHTKRITRNTADIVRALNAGERWRADVRGAISTPRLEVKEGVSILLLPHTVGEIAYAFKDGRVFRSDGLEHPWIPVLNEVENSKMVLDKRRHVTAWRWELELKAGKPAGQTKPRFSFQAVVRAAEHEN